jgi:hypothetical protein
VSSRSEEARASCLAIHCCLLLCFRHTEVLDSIVLRGENHSLIYCDRSWLNSSCVNMLLHQINWYSVRMWLARRWSPTANGQMQRPRLGDQQRESVSYMGRRRALVLHDTKDVFLTHIRMKKAEKSAGNIKNMRLFGWVHEANVNFISSAFVVVWEDLWEDNESKGRERARFIKFISSRSK